MSIMQQNREILRNINNPYTKVFNIYVTSVSIMQQHREILRDTNKPYTKVSNTYVTIVTIRQHNRFIWIDTNNLNTKIKDVKYYWDKSQLMFLSKYLLLRGCILRHHCLKHLPFAMYSAHICSGWKNFHPSSILQYLVIKKVFKKNSILCSHSRNHFLDTLYRVYCPIINTGFVHL